MLTLTTDLHDYMLQRDIRTAPLVSETFTPGSGWTSQPDDLQPATVQHALRLQRKGITRVCVLWRGYGAGCFDISELVTKTGIAAHGQIVHVNYEGASETRCDACVEHGCAVCQHTS